MRDKLNSYKLSIVSFLLVIIGLLLSRALLSLGAVALFCTSLAFFYQFNSAQKRHFNNSIYWIPMVFFFLNLLILFGYYQTMELVKDLEISILWFLFTFGVGVLVLKISWQDYSKIRSFLFVIVCLIGLFSVINYWFHQEEINQLLLQSKHIPIIGGMHHIYFGILNALLIITKIAEWIMGTNRERGKWLFIEDVCAVLIFIWLHILSSRTGLYAFYIVIPCLIIVALFFNFKIYKKLYWLIIPIIIMPIISYSFFPSFKNKIANTTEDLKATKEGGEEVNFKSMGMRLEAWKHAFTLIKQKPILGHGAGNVERVMQQEYNNSGSELLIENRIGPHNQFLEYAIKFGILGPILLLFLLIKLIFYAFGAKNLRLVGLIVFVSIILCLESILERQQGVILFSLIYFLAFPINKNDLIFTQ
jgi:O-antigen ligase